MKYLLLIMAVYAGIFSVLVFRNHGLYQTFGWDLGFFDQLLWQASRGNLNFVSTIGNINILGDHFQPVIYLLAPLYWLWDDVRIILIAQVVLITAAAVPLYLLANKKLDSRFAAIAVAVSYLLFSGTQFTITNEFHQSAFIPLLLSLGLWWMESGKIIKGLVVLFSLLLVKEEMGLLLAALGIMYFFMFWKGQSRLRRTCPLLTTGGLVGFFMIIKIVIPAVSSRGQYIHYGYGSFGNKPEEVLVSATRNPKAIISSLISPSVKPAQVFQSLAAFGGLPILSPVGLIPVVQQYTVRFLDDRNIHRWINNNHYSAPLGPLLAFGTILGFEKLRRMQTFYVAIYLIAASIVTAAMLRTPILSVFKSQLYFTPEWVKGADNLVVAVPPEAAVAANNSLAPHLSHRDKLYLLPEVKDARYIAVDLAEGPNKHAPWPQTKMREYIGELVDNGGWEVKQRFGEAMLLKRI